MPFIPEMHPGCMVKWDHFCTHMPPRSLALDGFVDGPSAYDLKGLHRNFDHHDGPPRSDMLCTAMQVLEAVREGLIGWLMPTGSEEVRVYMNDCDPDVVLAWYALTHHFLVEKRVNPALNRLFGYVQAMDKASGLVPWDPDVPIVGQAVWIFEPYFTFRFNGAIDRKDARAYTSVIQDVCARVNDFNAGRGQSLSPDERFESLSGGTHWVMVCEIGAYARMRLAREGVSAFVTARQKENGRWVYTVCRRSPYIWRFPVPEICANLNLGEAISDQFGGGDTVFGNARGNGSERGPEELASAINDFLTLRGLVS